MIVEPDVASRPRGTFTESQLLLLMVLVWTGVEIGAPAPLPVAVVIGAVALLTRRPLLFSIALLLLASGLSHRAEHAFRPAEARTLRGEPASIVLDAEPTRFGWQAEARVDETRQRVRLVGSGFGTPDLTVGEHVLIDGRLRPVEPTRWSKSRHLVGSVTVDAVESVASPPWYLRPGEWLRMGVLTSTSSFGADQEALYHGLVIGDDRFQSEGQRAQFRAAGLSHLLAVSGQNVAFLLAVCGPLFRRLPAGIDLVAIGLVLVTFALATRLEPSVLRATVTAGISALAVARSSRAAGVRGLALAVMLLLCVDPFLSGSIGFRLSVAASLGILLLAPILRDRLPGPRPLVEPVAITLAAQLGVSPLLMFEFGPVSTVTIPANLLAGWAAGAVMTLGLSIGIVAALLPESLAAILQLPSRLLVWWIAAVASLGARTPLPAVSLAMLPQVTLGALALWLWRPQRWAWRTMVLAVLGLMMVATAPAATVVTGWYPRTASTPSVLVVREGGPRADDLIAARIHTIDVVVMPRGGWSAAQTVARIREVADVGIVLAPGDHRIVGGRRVLANTTLVVGAGVLRISAGRSQLDVDLVVDRGVTR